MTPEQEASLQAEVAQLRKDLEFLKTHYWTESVPKIERLDHRVGLGPLEQLHPHHGRPLWKPHDAPLIGPSDPPMGVADAGHDRSQVQ